MKNIQLDHSAHKITATKFALCLLAHDVNTPMNIGSFFRLADALGVEKIYLTGCSVTPPHSKIKKTSRSAENYVVYEQRIDPLALVCELKSSGYKIVSLEITSVSEELNKFCVNKNDKICLILGAEASGVSQALLDVSDACIHIPMLGVNSSMNVANACAIAIYEITKKLAVENLI